MQYCKSDQNHNDGRGLGHLAEKNRQYHWLVSSAIWPRSSPSCREGQAIPFLVFSARWPRPRPYCREGQAIPLHVLPCTMAETSSILLCRGTFQRVIQHNSTHLNLPTTIIKHVFDRRRTSLVEKKLLVAIDFECSEEDRVDATLRQCNLVTEFKPVNFVFVLEMLYKAHLYDADKVYRFKILLPHCTTVGLTFRDPLQNMQNRWPSLAYAYDEECGG